MNVIAIYHRPQECGEPYIAVVNQQSGEIVEKITVPDGYYYSGMEMVETLQKVYSFTEEVYSTKVPTVGEYNARARYGSPGKRYTYMVTKVEVIGEDHDIIHTYNSRVYIDACLSKNQWRFSRKLDTFRQEMESQGFDMTGWCLYRRMHTDFRVFLKNLIASRNYHLVNLIEIG